MRLKNQKFKDKIEKRVTSSGPLIFIESNNNNKHVNV